MVIGKEARELIVLIANLLDHFGHHTEQREELLWACALQATIGNKVVRLVESLDEHVSKVEQQMVDLQTKATTLCE